VNNLYTHIGALSVFYDPAALLKGFLLGVFAAIAGAFVPSREAGAVTPVSVLRRSNVERSAQRAWKWLALAGLASFVISALLAIAPGNSAIPGLGAAFMLALGGALLSPGITRGFSKIAGAVFDRVLGAAGLLAARGIGNLSRTGLAVGALALALSMTIGVSLMVSSFRSTLNNWMSQSLHADVYLRPAGPSLLRHKIFMPEDVIAAFRKRPDVEAVDTYRGRDVILADGTQTVIVATDVKVTASRGAERFPMFAGDRVSAFEKTLQGEALISESLSRKRGLSVGSDFEVPTPTGSARLKVAGIYFEYATDRGVISLDKKRYDELFGDSGANSAALYLKPGADAEKVRDELRETLGAKHGLYIFSNRSLRAEAFKVFDQTFAITHQLESLSLAVGVCGIVTALLALLRERASEFALLRAIGLSAASLARLVVLEGALMGFIAFAVACVLGPALSLLLIHVINVRAFGWTIFFASDAHTFIRVGLLAVTMAALAAVFPALQARRMNLAAALREE
jgi:putative ABC transport system permease protein